MKQSWEKFGKIGVLMGGYSSEREISLKSGKAVLEAIEKAGADVIGLDIHSKEKAEIVRQIKESGIDVAFITLHGQLGEDGKIQGILDELHIPYPGTGAVAMQKALDKTITQKLLFDHGINVPDFFIAEKNTASLDKILEALSFFPLVVKPACEGSSIGVSIVKDAKELSAALKEAFNYGPKAIVEKFIKGRELTVGILDERALTVIEVSPKAGFFDYQAKYVSGTTSYTIPALLPQTKTREVQAMALKAHQIIGCRDLSRVDMILDEGGMPFFLEINTIPGFTSVSLLPKAAKAEGISFEQLCFKLIQLAYAKKKERKTAPVL